MIRVQILDVAENSSLLSMLWIRHLEEGVSAAHQVKAGSRGGQNDFVEAGDSPVDVVREGEFGIGHTEEGVEIGTAEIGVDHDDSLSPLGENNAQIGGEDRFADAALTAADRPDPRAVFVQVIVENVDHCSQHGPHSRRVKWLRARSPKGWYHLGRDVRAFRSVYRTVNELRGTVLEQV